VVKVWTETPATTTLPPSDASYLFADFDEYVRTHAVRLCRSAYLLTGDHQLAEDLVQTALAKVAPRWSAVIAAGDPAPYLRTVLVRTAIGWHRRRWRHEVATGKVPDLASRTDVAHEVSGRARLAGALATLTAKQRAAVVLRFYEDLSEADTAVALRCSVGSVKTHTSRALAHLRVALSDPTRPGGPS
jgi:RNA polymerase sigma-70 factor (sigma-E family)